jgi:hypothetical protein
MFRGKSVAFNQTLAWTALARTMVIKSGVAGAPVVFPPVTPKARRARKPTRQCGEGPAVVAAVSRQDTRLRIVREHSRIEHRQRLDPDDVVNRTGEIKNLRLLFLLEIGNRRSGGRTINSIRHNGRACHLDQRSLNFDDVRAVCARQDVSRVQYGGFLELGIATKQLRLKRQNDLPSVSSRAKRTPHRTPRGSLQDVLTHVPARLWFCAWYEFVSKHTGEDRNFVRIRVH